MIPGYLDQQGHPRLNAWLYFPAPVDHAVQISFLADTGLNWTTLHGSDALEFGVNLALLADDQHSIEIIGIGGGLTRPRRARAMLTLTHTDGQQTSLYLDIAVILTGSPSVALPSLIGMDVLRNGRLTVDGPADSVTWEVAPREFVLPPVS